MTGKESIEKTGEGIKEESTEIFDLYVELHDECLKLESLARQLREGPIYHRNWTDEEMEFARKSGKSLSEVVEDEIALTIERVKKDLQSLKRLQAKQK